MSPEPIDKKMPTDSHKFSLSELAKQSGATEVELRELVAFGALIPVNPDKALGNFNGKYLSTIHAARSLGVSFAIEPKCIALVVSLLDRIVEQDAELCNLRAQLPQHAPSRS